MLRMRFVFRPQPVMLFAVPDLRGHGCYDYNSLAHHQPNPNQDGGHATEPG